MGSPRWPIFMGPWSWCRKPSIDKIEDFLQDFALRIYNDIPWCIANQMWYHAILGYQIWGWSSRRTRCCCVFLRSHMSVVFFPGQHWPSMSLDGPKFQASNFGDSHEKTKIGMLWSILGHTKARTRNAYRLLKLEAESSAVGSPWLTYILDGDLSWSVWDDSHQRAAHFRSAPTRQCYWMTQTRVNFELSCVDLYSIAKPSTDHGGSKSF